MTDYVSASQGSSIAASVSVTCPFSITPDVLPEYVWGGNIILNYTATANVPCTIPSMGGYFDARYASNSVLASRQAISIGSVTYNAATVGSVAWDTDSVGVGNYTVSFNLTAFGTTAAATANVELLESAYINVTGANVSSPVAPGSQVLFTVGLKNIGALASNSFTLYINITGPSANAVLAYNESGLSPGQAATQSESISGYTDTQGEYNATVYVDYEGQRTDTVSVSYTVVAPPPTGTSTGSTSVLSNGGLIGSTPSVAAMQYVDVEFMPLLTQVSSGSSSLAPIVLRNALGQDELIELSIPAAYRSIASLYNGSVDPEQIRVTIPPGQSATATVDFSPPNGTSIGTYIIPVNATTLVGNAIVNSTVLHVVFRIYNSSQSLSGITSQLDLLDNGTVAEGDVQLAAYAGIKNATLETMLPVSIAANESDVSAYGIPNNVSTRDGYYVIDWYVENLTKGSTAIAYFEITDPNPALLALPIQTTLTERSAVNSSSLLTALSVTLPEFYTNSTNQLSIDLLYTGTSAQDVYLYLVGPPGVAIENSSRTVRASPNELLVSKFNVFTNSSPGTLLFYAYAITAGANVTYTLPVRVVQRQAQLSQSSPVGAVISSTLGEARYYLYAAIAAVAIAVICLIAARGRGRARYSKERANRLVMMRERIKREIDGHG